MYFLKDGIETYFFRNVTVTHPGITALETQDSFEPLKFSKTAHLPIDKTFSGARIFSEKT